MHNILIICIPIIIACGSSDGKIIFFLISFGLQPMSIYFPDISIKSSSNSSIKYETLRFWGLLDET